MTEAAIRKLVGGAYETKTLYNWDKKYILGALVSGKDGIAVCGLGGRDNDVLTSLHPYNVQTYKKELSPAQRPPEKIAEKPSLADRLNEAKDARGDGPADAGVTKKPKAPER
jgi:hypothetical protein